MGVTRLCKTLKNFYGLLVDSLHDSILDFKANIVKNLEDRNYYLCRENGKLYKNKPRNCTEFIEVTPREYARIRSSEYFSMDIVQLSAWEWLADNCNAKLCIDTYYPESKRVFFKGGFMHVLGINEPILVLYLRNLETARKYTGLLKCLSKAPFRVEVYLGPVGPAKKPGEVLSKL